MAKSETMLRGILTGSEILDYLTKEDVEKKIEALMEKDAQRWADRAEEFEKTVSSSLPDEEKERLMIDMVNERISGREAVETEQRMAALRLRQDYADFRKHENDAFNAIVSGNIPKYERALMKAVEAGNLVDMGLEYIENAQRFFSNFKVTKVKILSPEETRAEKAARLDDVTGKKQVDGAVGLNFSEIVDEIKQLSIDSHTE
ncbi:MAG: hypothetical protein LBS35_06155 [Synergistaceae bacterium]|jgi:hypothetical protein|nr:hypothetical protein [Synergistaceae bacterium]